MKHRYDRNYLPNAVYEFTNTCVAVHLAHDKMVYAQTFISTEHKVS